jgi:hypothetical protein
MIEQSELGHFDSLIKFSANFDEIWSHFKLCVSGLSALNLLKAYRACTEAFIKVSLLHNLPENDFCHEADAIDIVYESLGMLCASITGAILRANGKEELCKTISRTKKTSNLKFT